MGVLGEKAILAELKKGLEIRDLNSEAVGPASVHLTLDGLYILENGLHSMGRYALQARECIIAVAREFIRMPDNLCGVIYDICQMSRLQVGSQFVAPGTVGYILLKLYNIGGQEIYLEPGMAICELVLMRVE